MKGKAKYLANATDSFFYSTNANSTHFLLFSATQNLLSEQNIVLHLFIYRLIPLLVYKLAKTKIALQLFLYTRT